MKKCIYKFLGSLCVICFSVACAPSNVKELKQNAEPKDFIVSTNYQALFEELKKEINRCIFRGFLLAKTQIDAQLYPELGRGEIVVRYNNLGDKSVFVQVDIQEREDSARVIAYSANYGVWSSYSEKIQNFLQNETPLCK